MRKKSNGLTGRVAAVLTTPLKEQLPYAAYCMGWIICNGSIIEPSHGNSRWVSITGEPTDERFLKAIARYFHAVDTVVNERVRIVLRIRNKEFVEECEKNGLTRYKKDRAGVSDWLADSPDFWRGVIDSSGSYDGATLKITIHEELLRDFSSSLYPMVDTVLHKSQVAFTDNNSTIVLSGDLSGFLRVVYNNVATNDVPDVLLPLVSKSVQLNSILLNGSGK